jgi:hypothetical protein
MSGFPGFASCRAANRFQQHNRFDQGKSDENLTKAEVHFRVSAAPCDVGEPQWPAVAAPKQAVACVGSWEG